MLPNVVLIVFDAARRDAFEPYGAARGSTPAVSALARRGIAAAGAYATAPWTTPSHASIFTGLMPRAAGLSHVPSLNAARVALKPHRDRFLPEVLRRNGYATAGMSANPWASDRSGFGEGFDQFDLVDSERQARAHWGGRRARLRWIREVAAGRADDGARNVDRTLEAWLGSARKPFFCFVNLLECHFPYLPPRPYGRHLDRLFAAEDVRRYYKLDAIYLANSGMIEIPKSTLARARRLYAAAIRYMDDWLARVLERLDAARVLEDTLVIVTADHGENFGDGGLIGHMLSLDQRLIHVPLVAAGPGAESLDITSLAHLPSAVARAVGLNDHPWHDGPPAGMGLAQSDPLGDAGDPEFMQALTEAGITSPEGRELMTTALTCAVRDDLKLVRRGGTEEIFDLAVDPLEQKPLRASDIDTDRAAHVVELQAALDHPAMAISAAPGDEDPEQAAREMKELEDRMKLLGYM